MGRPKKQPEKPVWLANKTAYNIEYEKENKKRIPFTLNKNTDSDIIEYLETVPNKAALLKELIREHMNKTKEE